MAGRRAGRHDRPPGGRHRDVGREACGAAPRSLPLFDDFLSWEPIPPRSAKQLAEVSARLCRLLRDEVTEQTGARQPERSPALATDWRKLLFPEANDAQFADGYAQAVTFGLLMARARDIPLADGLDRAAKRAAARPTR